MNSAILLLGVVVVFVIGFFFYGRFLEKIFEIDPSRRTPAHEKYDGVDFVPAKHWMVLFGHHFSSICGAGPIVGPAIAVAYWGWAPAIVWIVLGTLFLGAVSDFSALMVSVRHGGKSITEVSGEVISQRARKIFAVFIWIALVLVIAVFAILAAKTLVAGPEIVLPSLGLIPIAVLCGWLLYVKNIGMIPVTVIGLSLLIVCLLGGKFIPIELPQKIGFLTSEQMWIFIFLIYCFIASITPVQYLLQPRDYLAAYILFAAVGIGVVGTVVSGLPMKAKAFTGFLPSEWSAAGPLWPMMFVTIACGAISGFHALVSSGTTCKQLGNESHACRVGYGGMVMEGLMGALVVICVGAGLSASQHADILRGPGAVVAFGTGYGQISIPLLGGYGKFFAIVALNAFILTTLDTGTRIGRYVTAEILGLKGRFLPTAIVVTAAAVLAFSGQWRRIWPAFGTSNQLIAALSLLVVSAWLISRGKPALFTLVPAIIMLVTTLGAFFWQLWGAVNQQPSPNFFLIGITSILIFLTFFLILETWRAVKRRNGFSS